MLKRTLAILTLVICGSMSLQAVEGTSSSSQSIEMKQSAEQQDLFAGCCGKRRPHKKRQASLPVKNTMIGCGKCKGKRHHLA